MMETNKHNMSSCDNGLDEQKVGLDFGIFVLLIFVGVAIMGYISVSMFIEYFGLEF